MFKPATPKELISELKDERSKLHDLAWELDDLERTLHEAAGPTTNDLLQQQRAELEEAVLNQMLHIERLEQRLEALRYPAIHAA